jgi:NADH:ubiquinone oxidoreductase subunit 4 (subunit M)
MDEWHLCLFLQTYEKKILHNYYCQIVVFEVYDGCIVHLAFKFNDLDWSVIIHFEWINSIKFSFILGHHTLNQYIHIFKSFMVLIFLYFDIHTIVHNFYNIVNIDTLGMHFQNFVLIFVLP